MLRDPWSSCGLLNLLVCGLWFEPGRVHSQQKTQRGVA